MDSAKKIILIGGGIGGVATALALHRKGFYPIVHERVKELKEVGAGIALWANATHVLKNLDLLSEAKEVGIITTNYQFNSKNGKELVNVPVNGFELPTIGIHRADLHELLWRRLPQKQFVLGETFERFSLLEDRVCAYFDSGLTVEGDALVVTNCLVESSTPAAAFQNYESQRFSRTKSVVEQSLRLGRMGQLAHPITVKLRETLMKLMKPAIKNSFKTLHAYRV